MTSLLCQSGPGPASSLPVFGSARDLGRAPFELHVHDRHDPHRARIESYIQQRYEKQFGAVLRDWLPQLVSVQIDGQIMAAAGYRDAAEPLFLERYLANRIEDSLPARDGQRASRSRIVEAGQFAATRAGAGRLLIPMLARHLRSRGYQWAVTTATRELRRMFTRMGISPMMLAPAPASALDEPARRDWGSYYEHDPFVVAGYLGQVVDELGIE